MISLEYKKIHNIQPHEDDISIISLAKDLPLFTYKDIVCDGFGNHLIFKIDHDTILLVFIIFPSEDFKKFAIFTLPLNLALKASKSELLFDYGIEFLKNNTL